MRSAVRLGLAVSFAAACAPEPPPEHDEPRRARPKHVLLVTLDTFRGDHLSAAGSSRVQTPRLDALSRRGALFTRARAPVPLTLPSHASLFTGLFPPEHGIRDNARSRLPETHDTLAERMRDAGFRTGGFPAAFVLDARFGLARGFDRYDDAFPLSPDELESPDAERSGEAVLASFFDWLGSETLETPFFAWVHLFEPHAPYDPPERFRAGYPHDPYAAEVAFTDELVGRLLDGLAERDALQRTLVVVVGDHGEGLGDHGETTHGLLVYNSTLHVPLIVAGPGVPAEARSDALVRTIDVAPTILELAGLDPSIGRGLGLSSHWTQAESESAERAAYSESLYASHHLGWSPLFGLEIEGHHFIDAPDAELFDVGPAGDETNDIASQQPARVRELRARLDELRRTFDAGPLGSGSALELDERDRARLESLGYLSTAARPGSGKSLTDPKDRIAHYESIRAASGARRRGDCRSAVATLAPYAAEEEPIPVVYETLGACYLDLGELEVARRVMQQGIAKGLRSPGLHVSLGAVALRRGRLREAEGELQAAIALDASHVFAHYHLGDVYRAARRDADALGSYQKALELNPRFVFAWSGKGVVLARLGREEDALESFRRVVSLAPEDPRGHFNLAAQLERTGRRAESLESYGRFLELAPETGLEREKQRARRVRSGR